MPWPSVWSSVVLAIGAEVSTVSIGLYDSVVGGCELVGEISVVATEPAASELPPAHTPAAITAKSTAAATPTGIHRATSFPLRPPVPPELAEREPDDREPDDDELRLP